MGLTNRDLEDIRELVEANPGAPLSTLKIHSRHADHRVRRGARRLAEQGVLVEVIHANTRYYWPAEEAPEEPAAVL